MYYHVLSKFQSSEIQCGAPKAGFCRFLLDKYMVDNSEYRSMELNQLTTWVPNRVAQQFTGFVKRYCRFTNLRWNFDGGIPTNTHDIIRQPTHLYSYDNCWTKRLS